MKTLLRLVLVGLLIFSFLTWVPEKHVEHEDNLSIAIDFFAHARSVVLTVGEPVIDVVHDTLLRPLIEYHSLNTDPGLSEPPGTQDPRNEDAPIDFSMETVGEKSVVMVFSKANPGQLRQGTGFIHSSGYVVTNEHVVRSREGIEIEFSSGRRSSATYAGGHETADVAFIEPERLPAKARALPLTRRDNVAPGAPVRSIGAPRGRLWSVGEGVVIGKNRHADTGDSVLRVGVYSAPGNSGSPILDERGKVLGLIFAGDRHGSSAVPSGIIEKVSNQIPASRNDVTPVAFK